MPRKPERVRDPLHNLIEFDVTEFEQVLWQVVQTPPFQRLRRIKQLGFSELVYPGATHTRFTHSLGVFQVARQLMKIIYQHMGKAKFRESRMHTALAAALVHDIGHGPFSHAFEEVGKKFDFMMARHEEVSNQLVRSSEVAVQLGELYTGFANDVADVINRRGPSNLYDAVVSSQFDADRLDYMQRDRLMSGAKTGAIDFKWLTANLDVAEVPLSVDEEDAGTVETFVLGAKAHLAAEAYVIGLFQLYPSIYYHKTTRGAEKIFSALLERLIELIREDQVQQTGLPKYHPLVQFFEEPDSLDRVRALDDMVIWGAISMLADAQDQPVAYLASRLRDRQLMKCIDIRERIVHNLFPDKPPEDRATAEKQIGRYVELTKRALTDWREENPGTGGPRILIDEAERDPYKRFEETTGPLNQIRIKEIDGNIIDVAELSPVVRALTTFRLFRAYVDRTDSEARDAVYRIVDDQLRGATHG